MKTAASWTLRDGARGLIGRKKVDWSSFEYGTGIPIEFHADFVRANAGVELARGESRDAYLIVEGVPYLVSFRNVDRDVTSDTLQIRYDSNEPLKRRLAERFHLTYAFLLSERARRDAPPGAKVHLDVPEALASYMDFVATGVPFHYRVELVPAVATSYGR